MDVKVAVSSLIFAASRCGELPELTRMRSLFRNWHGKEFDATNVNLLPTNLVKPELKRTLSAGSIPDDVKLEVIEEITKDYAVISCSPINCQQVRPKLSLFILLLSYMSYSVLLFVADL